MSAKTGFLNLAMLNTGGVTQAYQTVSSLARFVDWGLQPRCRNQSR